MSIFHFSDFQISDSQFRNSKSYRLDIIVVTPNPSISKFKSDNVARMRNIGANWAIKFVGPTILFFADDDTQIPSPDFFERLCLYHQENPSVIGAGGPYLTHSEARALDFAYNWICNAWMTRWPGIFLAGNLSLKVSLLPEHMVRNGIYPTDVEFGGEEWGLFENLKKHGFSVTQNRQFGIFHKPNCTLWNFIKRAWRNSLGSQISNAPKTLPLSWKIWFESNTALNQYLRRENFSGWNEIGKQIKKNFAICVYALITVASRRLRS